MEINHEYFNNNFLYKENVYILNNNDEYAENFGKQWKTYLHTQIDSINNFKISIDLLDNLLFNDINCLKNKKVLEIGSGAGRFTEIIVKYCDSCTSVDLSSAIFHNVAKESKKLSRIKANFIDLSSKKKFDIVICRGVLQHTPNPFIFLKKLFDFIADNGIVYFDYYPTPKIGKLHPKYLLWRPLFKNFIKYENCEKFLQLNIKKILKTKRLIKKIFFNSNFISDCFIPVWDYKDKLNLNDKQLNEMAICDTLDGLYAKYDFPKNHKKIINFLNSNNFKVSKYSKKNSSFKVKKK